MGVAVAELEGEVGGGFGAKGWDEILSIGEGLVVELEGVDGERGRGGEELRGEVWAGERPGVSWEVIGDLIKKWDVVKNGDGSGRDAGGGGRSGGDSFGAVAGEAGGEGGVAIDTGVVEEIGLWGGNGGSELAGEEILGVE